MTPQEKYNRTPEEKVNRAKRARVAALKGAEFLRFLKAGKPCADCECTFPAHAIDWDHVRGDKVASVSLMVTFSLEKMLTEILKCDLVCATCHRIRTWEWQYDS